MTSLSDPLLGSSMSSTNNSVIQTQTAMLLAQFTSSELLLNTEFNPPSPPWDEDDSCEIWTNSGGQKQMVKPESSSSASAQLSPELQDLMLFRPLSPTLSNLLDDEEENNGEGGEKVVIKFETTSHNNHLAALSLSTSTKTTLTTLEDEENEEEEGAGKKKKFHQSANQLESTSLSPEVTIYGTQSEEKDEKFCHSQTSIKPEQHYSNKTMGVVSHCGICKLVFSDTVALEQHNTKHNKSLTCCQCNKRFVSISKLVSHQRKHSKEKPFQCKSCGKYYTHRTTLVRHQQHYCQTLRAKCEDSALDFGPKQLLMEPGFVSMDNLTFTIKLEPEQNVIKCPAESTSSKSMATTKKECRICQSSFECEQTLSKHTERFLNLKKCCLCNKVLGNKSKLLTHHRSHTKESPYSCDFCGKSFSENSTLRKHEATHGAKNFQCHICDKGFVRKDYLAKHVLTHRQTYKCSQCDFICHERKDIELHVSVHNMEVVFGI